MCLSVATSRITRDKLLGCLLWLEVLRHIAPTPVVMFSAVGPGVNVVVGWPETLKHGVLTLVGTCLNPHAIESRDTFDVNT